VSHVPTLLLSGTLDGRTYPESQREAVAGLDRLQAITVVNAGHNLFMTSPEVTTAIERFMRGEPLQSPRITVPLPDFTRILPPGAAAPAR
jgi:pimeloyl-ACP methyl ester carboxylesterase